MAARAKVTDDATSVGFVSLSSSSLTLAQASPNALEKALAVSRVGPSPPHAVTARADTAHTPTSAIVRMRITAPFA